jgi:hypothetical protein
VGWVAVCQPRAAQLPLLAPLERLLSLLAPLLGRSMLTQELWLVPMLQPLSR